MRLGSPEWLFALGMLPVLVAAFAIARARSNVALLRFAGRDQAKGNRAAPAVLRRSAGLVILLLGLAFLSIAIARPQWNPRQQTVQSRGRDVVFIIDVSRSMLARDLAPNRLERTKLWVNDLVHGAAGDRFGLVAFAGAAVIKSPLTNDHGFFRQALDELSPQSVPVGGTNIGDAIRKTIGEAFDEADAGKGHFQDIILITDGEDQDSLPVEAAQLAGKRGIRIIALGLGSDQSGAAVPADGAASGQTMRHEGRQVLSKQDSRVLAQIASATPGGVYLNVGTGTISLDRVYQDLVRSASQRTTEDAKVVQYDEGFQWLLLAAFVLVFMEVFVRAR